MASSGGSSAESLNFDNDIEISSARVVERSSARVVETSSQPRSRMVKEFTDRCGTFQTYLVTMDFEVNPDFDQKDYCDGVYEVDENHVANPREALIEHFKQVRQSFGFDLDVVVPSWANVSFYPIDLSVSEDYGYMMSAAGIAIDGINDDMGRKSYELVKVEKAVVSPNWMHHLTIAAKKVDDGSLVSIQAMVLDQHPWGKVQLEQWRFKPEAPAAT